MLNSLEAVSPQTRGELVYRQLRRRLLVGGVMPKERLSVRTIASALSVSFTPAREALSRLAAEGALIAGPRFFAVPQLTVSAAEEIYRARMVLEEELAVAALGKLDRFDIENLQLINKRQQAAFNEREYGTVLEANHAFHFGIYTIAQMPIILQIVEELWVRCGPSLNYMYPRLKPRVGYTHGHLPIIKAIKETNVEGLKEALRNDLLFGLSSIKQSIAEQSQESPPPAKA